MNEVKQVTVYEWERFEKKLAALNKKAQRAGLPPVRFGNVREETKSVQNRFGERTEVFSNYVVDLDFDYDYVRFPGGYSLVGVIDHFEGLVRSVPDVVQVPLTPFVERGAVCDHCGLDRNRKETFVVVDAEGALLQVGRQCVGDLLGVAPERVLGQVDLVKELLDDEEWLGERQVRGTDLAFYLSHVCALVRTAGWRSATAAKEQGGASTAGLASDNIFLEEVKKRDRFGEPLWVDRTQEDKVLAAKVREWLNLLGERSGLNDYLANLAQIGRNDFVTEKSKGFAASAVAAYAKEQEQKLKQAAQRASGLGSAYLGEVGKRVNFNVLRLVKSPGFDTDYGYTFIHKFLDQQGNVVVWRTATELNLGAEYAVVGSVKAHEEYQGEKQTVITRAKTEKL